MAVLDTQQAAATGLEAAYDAASVGGDSMPCDGRTVLHVVNDDVGAHVVTIASEAVARPGLAAANIVVNVPAGESRFILPDPTGFADENGRAAITYDDVTDVTVAAIRI